MWQSAHDSIGRSIDYLHAKSNLDHKIALNDAKIVQKNAKIAQN